MLAAECVRNCTYIKSTAGLLTDLPHWTMELIVNVVVDGLGIGIGLKFLKKKFRREHERLDTEHGYVHGDDK